MIVISTTDAVYGFSNAMVEPQTSALASQTAGEGGRATPDLNHFSMNPSANLAKRYKKPSKVVNYFTICP